MTDRRIFDRETYVTRQFIIIFFIVLKYDFVLFGKKRTNRRRVSISVSAEPRRYRPANAGLLETRLWRFAPSAQLGSRCRRISVVTAPTRRFKEILLQRVGRATILLCGVPVRPTTVRGQAFPRRGYRTAKSVNVERPRAGKFVFCTKNETPESRKTHFFLYCVYVFGVWSSIRAGDDHSVVAIRVRNTKKMCIFSDSGVLFLLETSHERSSVILCFIGTRNN